MPWKVPDLLGKRFGKLIVLIRLPNKANRSYWLCLCDCGKQREASTKRLNNGNIKSCNCLISDVVKQLWKNSGYRKKNKGFSGHRHTEESKEKNRNSRKKLGLV